MEILGDKPLSTTEISAGFEALSSMFADMPEETADGNDADGNHHEDGEHEDGEDDGTEKEHADGEANNNADDIGDIGDDDKLLSTTASSSSSRPCAKSQLTTAQAASRMAWQVLFCSTTPTR